jgi:NAD(P)-dependent dehydrogenase (short-subunit alcohol dehydrogenase family)
MRFAAEGANIVAADVNAEAVAKTASEVVARGGEATACVADVRDETSLRDLAALALERYGQISALFHSAGITAEGTALTCDRTTWDNVLGVNLTGSWLAARAVLPAMVEASRGSIVLVASVAGLVGLPAVAAYAAAKGGVVALCRQMAVDFARDGIRVNAICPGTVLTPLVLKAYTARGELDPNEIEAGLARAAERYPLRRLGTVDDVAHLGVYLASDEAAWMTGAAVQIDGGLVSAGWQPGA